MLVEVGYTFICHFQSMFEDSKIDQSDRQETPRCIWRWVIRPISVLENARLCSVIADWTNHNGQKSQNVLGDDRLDLDQSERSETPRYVRRWLNWPIRALQNVRCVFEDC